ncbi:MAG: DUF3656 domain-containing protein, partial [Bacteroidaceae bacterium]|nr:DUF3656 domain-containing protein [Bacteroidales bacterium]MCF0185489.1 DUF3656 domain-containing protein [Bacteroidaceae bacterium]
LKMEQPVLSNGDGLCFINKKGETVGFRADKVSGERITCKAIEDMFIGARIYRNMDITFEKSLEKRAERLLEVTLDIHIGKGRLKIEAVREDGTRLTKIIDISGYEEANNPERILGLINVNLSKKAGRHRFEVKTLNSEGDLPLLSSAWLNEIRRTLAEEFDNIAIASTPILNRNEILKGKASTALSTKEKDLNLLKPAIQSYKANVANLPAARFYGSSLSAYELHHQKGAELMRTRHCIRREFGACLKEHPEKLKAPLKLLNNGKSFELLFDCTSCEMIIK